MENNNCCGSEPLRPKKPKVNPMKVEISELKLSSPGFLQYNDRVNSCSCDGICPSEQITPYDKRVKWVVGEIKTTVGIVPQVSTHLKYDDVFGTWKARWGINRMNYKITPGLYAVGTPDHESPVLVSANYKLTFDALRKELNGLNLWILILDTKGINVWCAAAKGTFGTKELLNQIGKTKLSQIVSHKILILPQLGAPGIAAHEITKHSDFKVVYGPIQASDINEFLRSGMRATPEMRKVKFSAYDRLVLTPMELVGSFKISLMIFGVLFLVNLLAAHPFGFIDFYVYVGALITGCVLAPALLPWIPGRAFAFKGWVLGLLWTISVNTFNWPVYHEYSIIKAVGYLLIFPAMSAFYAMNFTGSSTYTSFSGVLKEMKVAVPAIVISIASGIVLILAYALIRL